MTLKKMSSIPETIGRLSPSIDFSGYIYPQFFTVDIINSLNAVNNLGINASGINMASNTLSAIASTFGNSNDLLSVTLGAIKGEPLGGVVGVNQTSSRVINRKENVGNNETTQLIPGRINVTLSMEKVVFYNDHNALDTILKVNEDGLLQQIAPLMIIKNERKPNGDYRSYMYIDCWFSGSSIKYDLEGDNLVVNKIDIQCARQKLPFDIISTVTKGVIGSGNLIRDAVANFGGIKL